jgi:hypothetical protein
MLAMERGTGEGFYECAAFREIGQVIGDYHFLVYRTLEFTSTPELFNTLKTDRVATE